MGGVGSVLSNPRKVAPICQEAIHPRRESGRDDDQQDQDHNSLKKSGSGYVLRNQEDQDQDNSKKPGCQETINPTQAESVERLGK